MNRGECNTTSKRKAMKRVIIAKGLERWNKGEEEKQKGKARQTVMDKGELWCQRERETK